MNAKKIIMVFILVAILLSIVPVNAINAHTVFYVQVGVYYDINTTAEVFSNLRQLGFKINIDSFGSYTKVYAGYYRTKAEADTVSKIIEGLGYSAKVKSENFSLEKYKDNNVYNIVVGSYKNITESMGNLEILRSHQISFKVSSTDNIRIYLGDFNTLKEAEDSQKELSKIGLESSIVKKSMNEMLQIETFSEEGNEKDVATKNFILKEDQLMSGLYGSHTMFFYKNSKWGLINKPYIELNYQRNQLVTTKDSTITVLLNDLPVYSEIMKDENKVRIYFDKKQVKDGFNSVTFKSFNRVSDLPCEDDLNPANWFKILGSTYIHIDYLAEDDELGISDFPYPYIVRGLNTPVKMKFILPPNPDNDEIAATMMFSSLVGSIESSFDSDIEFITYSQEINPVKDNLVFISKRDNVPVEYARYFTKEELKQSENTVVKEIYSPYNQQHKMLGILWGSKQTYSQLLSILQDNDITKQIMTPSYTVTKSTYVETVKGELAEEISLRELGYTGKQVEGLFDHKTKYDFHLPSNWEPDGDVQLNLHLRYSDILDFSKSMITVFVNDIPIGSKKLSESKVDNDFIDFTLSKDSLSDSGYYNIDVQLSLYVKDTYCETRVDRSVWAYIVEDSFISFPHKISPFITLNKYDGLFINNKHLEDINIVLPNKPSQQEIRTALMISNHLGRYAKELGKYNVYLGELPNNLTGDIIAIYSADSEDAIVTSANRYAYVKYNVDTRSYDNTLQIPIVNDKFVGSMQIVPYNKEFKLLLINGENEIALEQVTKQLTSTSTLFTLNGDVSLVNIEGILKTAVYNLELEEYLNEKKKLINKQHEKKQFSFSLDFSNVKTIVLIMSIIVMIFGTIIYLRRKQ